MACQKTFFFFKKTKTYRNKIGIGKDFIITEKKIEIKNIKIFKDDNLEKKEQF